MAMIIGKVSNLENIVRAITPVTQEMRMLTPGDSIFANDLLTTSDDARILIEFNNGEVLTIGRSTHIVLDDDVYPVASIDVGTEAIINNLEMLQQTVLEGNFEDLEETAAGEYGALGSASEGGIQISRIASEGKVNTGGFSTVAHAQGITDVLTHRFDEIEEKHAKEAGNILTLDEDSSLSIDVTSGANGLKGSDFTITITSQPVNGSLIVNGDGTITYKPNLNFNGKDHFSYVVSDGFEGTHKATANLIVAAVNDDPIAENDNANVGTNGAATINVLANDSDLDGDTIEIASIVQPTNGTVSINNDGTLNYAPAANFTGKDTFTYTITDGNGGTSTGTVTVTVEAMINQTPILTVESTKTVNEDGSTAITYSATDIDGTATVTANALNGTVVVNDNGTITYTPNANFFGTDTITVTATDNEGATAVQTSSITINDINDAPVIDAIATQTVAEDGSKTISFNATDADLDTLTPSVTTTHGAAVIDGNGDIIFTPTANFNGTATVTLSVTDGVATTTKTFTINVTATNDAPVVTMDSVTTDENVAYTFTTNDFGYSDIDGDALSAVTISQLPTSGTITLSGTPVTVGQVIIAAHINAGNLVFTPAANDSTDVSFDFQATDGSAWSNTTTNNITVNAVSGGSSNFSFSISLDTYSGAVSGHTDHGSNYGNENTWNGNQWQHGQTLTGTTSNDTFNTGNGDNKIVSTGSGNDDIIMGQGNGVTINADAGDDRVEIKTFGTSLNINTGNGDDRFINSSGTKSHSNSAIDTGTGDDYVQMIVGDNIQYSLGSGNDIIENTWAYTQNIARGQIIDGGTGADTLILKGNSYDYHVTDNGDGTYTVQPVHESLRYNDLTITNIENIQYLDKTISVGSDTSDGVFEYDMTLNAGSAVGTDTFSSITLTNVPAGVTITGATDNGDGTFTVPVDASADASITLVSTTALSSSDLNSMIGTITATSVDTSTQDISASLDVTVNVGVSATAPVVTMSISQATVAQGEINTSHADMGAGYGNQNTIDSMTYSTHAWDDRIVNGTDQNDTINVIQGLRQTVSSGDGDDLVITADNENISSLNLDTGAGNDRVVLGDGAQRINNVINTGTGDDRVEIANGLDNVWADNMVINTGAGDDYVEHSSGRRHEISLGDGNDTYEKTQATDTGLNLGTIDYTETVEGGSANDILYDGNGDRLINSAPTVDGGQGVDTYIINGNSGDYRVTARADGTYEVAETMGNAWDTGRFSMLLVNMEHVQFNDTTVDLTPFTEQNYSYDVVLHTELTDTDGSETLSDITLGNVPAGVVVLEGGANQQHPDGAGNYILSPNGNGDVTVTFTSYTPLTTDELNAITASATSTETANGLTATTTVTAPVVYNEVAISDETGVTNGNLLDNVDAGSTLDSVVYNGTTYNAADYAGGLTINTLSGGTLVLDFTTGTYTSTGTGTDETFTVNATDSQSNAVSFTFDANDIAGVDAGILYGDDLAAEQFNIETGHDTTIVDFDYANDVLDLSEVITGPVDADTLSNYLDFTFGAIDTDGDGNMDVTSITVDADANAATVDDITVINLQDSLFDIDQVDDLKVDYQDN